MGISKQFLLDQMSKLELNYGAERFKVNQDMFDLWYEMFADLNEKGFELAVNKCIKESEFAPSIATVMKIYRTLEADYYEFNSFVLHQYTTIRSIWGEKYDAETYKELIQYILRFPEKTRKTELVEFTHKAVSFSHDCDAVGRLDKPTIKEYIQGAR